MPSFVQARQKVIEVAVAQHHNPAREMAYLAAHFASGGAASGAFAASQSGANACGRVLAEGIAADRDYPPFDRSTRDGFAVRAADAAVPGVTLDRIGETLYRLEKYGQAEMAWGRSLQSKLRVLGSNHPAVAVTANNLAGLHYLMGRYSEAESYTLKCIEIYENGLGPEHPNVAICLHNLASLHHVQGKYQDAEPYYKRTLEIRIKSLGAEHPDTLRVSKHYADLLKTLGRNSEADNLSTRATGLISGVWKTIDIPESEALIETDDQFNAQLTRNAYGSCKFCGAIVKAEGKCSLCGMVQVAV